MDWQPAIFNFKPRIVRVSPTQRYGLSTRGICWKHLADLGSRAFCRARSWMRTSCHATGPKALALATKMFCSQSRPPVTRWLLVLSLMHRHLNLTFLYHKRSFTVMEISLPDSRGPIGHWWLDSRKPPAYTLLASGLVGMSGRDLFTYDTWVTGVGMRTLDGDG